jgi:peptide/nickel transport system ATP-binding protein
MIAQDQAILRVNDLRVYYWTARGAVRAVDGISFTVNRKERFGLVGESGCGKSTTAMALLRLIKPPGSVESGQITLDDIDMLSVGKEEVRQMRWSRISLIPQGAMNSLNPVMRIRDQIGDAITTHEGAVPSETLETRITELLNMVDLPARVVRMYPHELSGGMKQRVCIAMAIALSPNLIIADEPTSALDVVVQRSVMQTLIEVQERLESSLILIGHDMGLIAQAVNRLAVMYAGKIAEIGGVREMFNDPLHPYTRLLISTLPSPKEKRERVAISGLPPTLLDPPPGCLFHPRCPEMMEICGREEPEFREARPGRLVACHLYNGR